MSEYVHIIEVGHSGQISEDYLYTGEWDGTSKGKALLEDARKENLWFFPIISPSKNRKYTKSGAMCSCFCNGNEPNVHLGGGGGGGWVSVFFLLPLAFGICKF